MIAVNAASQLVALGSILVLQTVYMIVVARILGPEDFGRFSFAWSIIQIMLIGGDLGLHNTAVREISANLRRSVDITRTFLWLKTVLVGFLFLLVLLISVLMHETEEARVTLAIFGVGMFLHSISMALNVVFQAHGKLYFASLNVLLVFVIQTLVGLSALYMGGRLIALATAYFAGVAIAGSVNLFLFVRRIHPVTLGRGDKWREFALDSIPVGASTLFHTISSRIGIALVTFLAGPYQTGVFSAAVRIPQALGNIPGGIFSAVLPAMAAHQEDSRPVKRLFRKSLLLMAACSIPLALTFFIIAEPVILLIYGAAYQESVGNLKILTWSMIPVFTGMAFSHVILSQHRLVKRLPLVTGAALIVNVIVNLILIPRLGSSGACISLLLTEAALAAGYVLATKGYLSGTSRSQAVSGTGDGKG